MGIKHLNKFLREQCKKSIYFAQISDLSNKKIAVDISIYMYKFVSENTLIENMYLMLSVFRHYNITPIFVFDGKPPTEKKELLSKRRENKKDAEEEFNRLKEKLKDNDMSNDDKQEIMNNMDMLKKQFIYITKEQTEYVKRLVRAYGATYYDAHGEADELCAQLTIKNKVWATLSEDMDMFVYGATRVLRYMSLLNHTVVVYDTKGILQELGITQRELRQICVISGTDYNMSNDNTNNEFTLHKTLKQFKKFHKLKTNEDFYDWLNKSDLVEDFELLNKIYEMFDLTNNNKTRLFDDIRIANGIILHEEIKNILREDGFIFPN
jgi:5'-3' exonuclease